MATKREVMLAGVAAKLAHMIASDQEGDDVVAGGTDQASATLIPRNFINIVTTGPNQGLRLKPATGQYLHVMRNHLPWSVNVFPDSDEQINQAAPGGPFLLEAAATGLFVPSRRKWIAGAALGGGEARTFNGPVGVGMTPPTDAPPGDLFINELLVVALGLKPGQVPPPSGRMAFNAYWDSAGTWRYLADGPAFQIRYNASDGTLTFHAAANGLAGQPIATWNPVAGSPMAVFGPNAVGFGVGPPVDAHLNSIFANYVNVPWSAGVGGNLASRINFNCYLDTALQLRYAADGPAYRIVFPSVGTAGLHVRAAVSGTMGSPLPALSDLFAALSPDQTTAGQTNVWLVTNEAGTLTFQAVLVGPAGSGPGGSGRALYVAT